MRRLDADRASGGRARRTVSCAVEVSGLLAGIFVERFRLRRSDAAWLAAASASGSSVHKPVTDAVAEPESSVRFHLAQTVDLHCPSQIRRRTFSCTGRSAGQTTAECTSAVLQRLIFKKRLRSPGSKLRRRTVLRPQSSSVAAPGVARREGTDCKRLRKRRNRMLHTRHYSGPRPRSPQPHAEESSSEFQRPK